MRRIFVFVFAFLFAGGILSASENDTMVIKTLEGKELHIKGTDNGLDIEEYKGKVVFVEFWGTHCPPCRLSIPHYINLNKKYKDKLAMLAIEVQDTDRDILKRFVENKGINYDISTYEDANDFVNYIIKRSGWTGNIPFLLILDGSGNVVTMQVGMLDEKALGDLIVEIDKKSKTIKNASNETGAKKL